MSEVWKEEQMTMDLLKVDSGAVLPALIGFQLADRLLGCSRDGCSFSCSLVHIELFETDHCKVLN